MSKLEKFDQNMAASTAACDADLYFPDCFAPPFRLEGFPWYAEDGKLHRLPAHMAARVSEGVAYLSTQAAGGNICFRTDSNRLYIEAEVTEGALSPKFTPCGRCGFDVYAKWDGAPRETYLRTVQPDPGEKRMSLDIPDIAYLLPGGSGKVQLRINFPPYDGVEMLRIGLTPGAQVWAPTPYTLETPVVFYGSSITQGGCASRPGNSYTNHLSRRLNVPIHNLGFSGSAKGEAEMAHIIAGLSMSAFVLDYDHNAPTLPHLQATHEPFFQIIRRAQPELPIIMLTKPNLVGNFAQRRDVIRRTYENAIAAGDKYVWFIDGQKLFGEDDRDACTVDGVHPNDLGFLRMANAVEPVLRRALGID